MKIRLHRRQALIRYEIYYNMEIGLQKFNELNAKQIIIDFKSFKFQ